MRGKSVPLFLNKLLGKFRNDAHDETVEYLLVCLIINILTSIIYECLSVSVNAMCVQCQGRPEEGPGSPGTGVSGWERCWEWSLSPLEMQPELSTAEPSQQPKKARASSQASFLVTS